MYVRSDPDSGYAAGLPRVSGLLSTESLDRIGDHCHANQMLKSDLVHRMSLQNPHLRGKDVEKIIDTILDEIILAMARGDRVEIRGFGAFSVRQREAHSGRNPRTGAEVAVRKKLAPHFKAGKEIRSRLNSNPAALR